MLFSRRTRSPIFSTFCANFILLTYKYPNIVTRYGLPEVDQELTRVMVVMITRIILFKDKV
jgi:hypothetical protein